MNECCTPSFYRTDDEAGYHITTSSSAMACRNSIRFMTYNVWSCEHVAVYRRIHSICEIIEQHDPDVIFLQEVTDYIYSLFQEAPWWGNYSKFSSKGEDQDYNYSPLSSNSNPFSFCLLLSKLCAQEVALPEYDTRSSPAWSPSPPRFPRALDFPSDLLSARVSGAVAGYYYNLRAATCSLASPTPAGVGCVHRRARASAFLEHLDAVHQPRKNGRRFRLDENVVLGGDLGWDDDLDGPLRLGGAGSGWVDAWQELRGGDGGWTYDAVANPMLRGLNLPAARRRPDRFICRLRDFKLDSIQMLGVEPIAGVTCFVHKGNAVPVFPSHRFGLLLTISPER